MQLRGDKWKYKCEKMMYTMETIKLSLFQFCLYVLFMILKENQEINTQGTNIQKNNSVVRSTGITEKNIYISLCLQGVRIF